MRLSSSLLQYIFWETMNKSAPAVRSHISSLDYFASIDSPREHSFPLKIQFRRLLFLLESNMKVLAFNVPRFKGGKNCLNAVISLMMAGLSLGSREFGE